MNLKVDPVSIEAASSHPHCKVGQYGIVGSDEGVKIDSKKEQMKIDTSKAIGENQRYLMVGVGSQFVKSPAFTFEIYDCTKILTFAQKIKVQVDSITQVFNAVASNAQKADCQESSFSFDDKPPKGVTLNKTSGQITVATTTEIKPTKFSVAVKVGSQKIYSPNIAVEVFDCTKELTFVSDMKVQVGNVTQIFDAVVDNKNTEDCKQNIYGFLGDQRKGISINKITGQITVKTTEAIKSTELTVFVQMGS